MKRIATGGPLNYLNEMFGCNSRSKTVQVMSLLNAHPTTDPTSLKRMIEEHSNSECKHCCIRSTGPVEKFALDLFQCQFKPDAKQWLKKNGRHTYQQCLHFQEALFCEAPIRGMKFEQRSRHEVEKSLSESDPGPEWRTRQSSPSEDFDLGVDYFLLMNGITILGVQVKPTSVMGREDVMNTNKDKHSQCPHPVLFHFYDTRGVFQGGEEICSAASKILHLPNDIG